MARLAKMGFEVERIPVDAQGVVSEDAFARLLRPDTWLVSVMLANHETGAVQPVARLASRVGQGTRFHCDAAAAAGKMPVHFHDLQVTSLTVSAHKFHGPKGVGALLVRKGERLTPLLWGGHQQQGRRPGTEPVALAVGLATALDLAVLAMEVLRDKVTHLRRRFLDRLRATAAPVVVNGPEEGGVPHTLNLSFPGCRADLLLMNLDLAGVACSTGSACSSGSLLPSPVIKAMGVTDEVLHSAMRFSSSALLSEEEVEEAAERITRVVKRLRDLGN
jgi:cysteine desulfurase